MTDLYSDSLPPPAEVLRILQDTLEELDERTVPGKAAGRAALMVLAAERRALVAVAAAAVAVRAAQRQYFRAKDNLTECKQLEAELDRRLRQL